MNLKLSINLEACVIELYKNFYMITFHPEPKCETVGIWFFEHNILVVKMYNICMYTGIE